eukprot:6517-Pyramimonas_sp.AAC.1
MVKTGMDQAPQNYNEWVPHSVATGTGGIHADTKMAQSWNAKPAKPDGKPPSTIHQCLQTLVDEWSGYWDVAAPSGQEPARHHIAWPQDLGERPDRPSVAELRE